MNGIRMEEKEEDRLVQECVEEAVLQGAVQGDSPLCFIRLEKKIPTKYLLTIADQVSVRLRKPAAAVFVDVSEDGSGLLVGVGVDHDHEGLADAMTNPLSRKTGVKDGYIYAAVKGGDYENYRKEVLKKFATDAVQ